MIITKQAVELSQRTIVSAERAQQLIDWSYGDVALAEKMQDIITVMGGPPRDPITGRETTPDILAWIRAGAP